MRSKLVAQLLADLGVTKTHSRPHVSNDNPFSEASFKTLKYRPDFPERFGCIEDARAYCVDFFAWYNDEHYHSGLGLQTPADVHHGRAQQRVEKRAAVLAAAHAVHPERFVRGGSYERLAIAAKYTERSAAQQFLACCLLLLRHSINRDFSSRKTIDRAERIVNTYERIAANGNIRLQLTELAL